MTTDQDTQAGLPRVLVGDDHHLILDALHAMMKNQFEFHGVDNCQSFINAVDCFRPDIAILDVSMPGSDGFSTARKALERRPNLPLVFLSMYSNTEYFDQAAKIGAKAFLSKRIPGQQLIAAIHSVLQGETILHSRNKPGVGTSDASLKLLTSRQKQVLTLIARGGSAKDIANELNISVRTAEFHRAAIMQRLGLRSTAQMTRYALANNLA